MTFLPMLLQVADPQLPATSTGVLLVATVVKMLAIFTLYMVVVAYTTLAERKISAWIQDRHGPNRVGPGGLMQPLADGLKNLVKEEAASGAVNKALFMLAPTISFTTALIAWAVIPFASPLPTPWGRIDMVLADLPIGFLYVLAITSLGVYGIVLAGWASNNKYALLGGLRSSAQMVSYEIAMGMSVIPVLLLAGNVTMGQVIAQQQAGLWNVLNLTVAFFTFMVAAFAETNRLPFDLPEAESELITGYHTEYSSMKFSMFFIAEYANMITASALMVTLFFGGWDIPGPWDSAPWSAFKTLATMLFFMAKVGFFVFTFIWIRWTLPRFRYDQLMSLGWKFMLPVALAYIVLIATVVVVLEAAGIRGWMFNGALLLLNIVLCVGLFGFLDRGRLVSPASSRLDRERIERLRRRALTRNQLSPEAGD